MFFLFDILFLSNGTMNGEKYISSLLKGNTPIFEQLQLEEPDSKISGMKQTGVCDQQIRNNNCGLVLRSSFVNGIREGRAIVFDSQERIYMNLPFSNGKLDGEAFIYDNTREFQIKYSNGKPTGYATILENGKLLFKGSFLNGYAYGDGEFVFSNNMVYRGFFKNGLAQGNGTITNVQKNTVLKGSFSEGTFRNYRVSPAPVLPFIRDCRTQPQEEDPCIVYNLEDLTGNEVTEMVQTTVEIALDIQLEYISKSSNMLNKALERLESIRQVYEYKRDTRKQWNSLCMQAQNQAKRVQNPTSNNEKAQEFDNDSSSSDYEEEDYVANDSDSSTGTVASYVPNKRGSLLRNEAKHMIDNLDEDEVFDLESLYSDSD